MHTERLQVSETTVDLLNAAIPVTTSMSIDAWLQAGKKEANREGQRAEMHLCAHKGPESSHLVIGIIVLLDNLLQEIQESLVEIFK